MADRSYGEIVVFGELTQEKAEELLNAIEGDNPLNVNGYNKEAETDFNLADSIIQGIKEDGQLKIFDPSARGGEFDCIESCCRENGLGYIRFSEADMEYDAEKKVFDPKISSDVIHVDVTQSGHTVVRASEIRDVIEKSTNNNLAENLQSLLDKKDPEIYITSQKLTATKEAMEYLEECAKDQKAGMRLG